MGKHKKAADVATGKRGKYGQGRVFQPKYKAADGTTKLVTKWYVQYYDKAGNQRRESTDAKSEKEARGLLAIRLGQVQQGNAPKVDERSLRYGDLREDLLRQMSAKKLKSLETLADGTETVKGLTKLDEFFGFKLERNTDGVVEPGDKGMKISAFSNDVWIDDFIEGRRKEGVSDATIVNSAKLLNQMFKQAVKSGRMVSAPKIFVPKAPDAREEFLYKEQFDTLFRKNGMDKRFHALLIFLFYQGVRINETLGIKWDRINLSEGVFFPVSAENKTGNRVPKPLQKDVVNALGQLPRTNEFVFEAARSDGKHAEKMFEKAFRKAMLRLKFGEPKWQCSQCRAEKTDPAPKGPDSPAILCPNCNGKGVPMQYHYVGPTPHCLRASCVVFYRESGMSDAEIMAITGHKSTKAFLGYSRTHNEATKQQMDAANALREKMKKETAKASKQTGRPQLVA